MAKKRAITIKRSRSISDYFEEFLMSKMAIGITEATKKTYQTHLSAISHHLDIHKEIEKVSSNDIERMIASMRASNLSPNSIRSYTITLRAFFSWCEKEGITSLKIHAYKGVETVKEIYTDEELAALLKKPNLRKCYFAEYRNWVIINLLVNNGIRAASIRNIKNGDVYLNNKAIKLSHTKNRKVQIIPLCDMLCSILAEYMKIRGGTADDYLFPSESNEQLTESGLRCTIVRYNRNRGIDKTSIHLFRHTFAHKYLIDCHGDAFTLQKLLGHSTLDMSKHYCEINDIDIAKTFESMSPLANLYSSTSRMRKIHN